MYFIINNKNNSKLFRDEFNDLDGFSFGVKNKIYKINGEEVINLTIYNKKLAHPIVKKQVDKKYQKLMLLLSELLVSDDEDDTPLKEALNQIEKFRQTIKNKYREYLTRKELEAMSKKLSLIQKEAKTKLLEINLSLKEEQTKSTCK